MDDENHRQEGGSGGGGAAGGGGNGMRGAASAPPADLLLQEDQQRQLTLSAQQSLHFLDQQALFLNMTPEQQQRLIFQQQLLLMQFMQTQQEQWGRAMTSLTGNRTMTMPQQFFSPLQLSMLQNQPWPQEYERTGSNHPQSYHHPSSASMVSLRPTQAGAAAYLPLLPAAPIAAASASLPFPSFAAAPYPFNPLAQIDIESNNAPQVSDLSDSDQAVQANIRQYFLSIGLCVSQAAIDEIIRTDESNFGRSNVDSDDEEDDDPNSAIPSRKLIRLVEDHHWVAALERISTHPRETSAVGIQGRTPLHVACDHDAPAALVQAILAAWPEGADRTGTSRMNPLHITCSSANASIDVVQVLLTGCRDPIRLTGAKDVDGDTPLHAACRCGAPIAVLIILLQENPVTVLWRDYEGLNPLMRLWVRYYVIVGEQIISNLKLPSDLTSDLVEAWERTVLLLQVMNAMDGTTQQRKQMINAPFLAVHASSYVNCPRCVVRMAMVLFPEQLLTRDEAGLLPIHIAAAAPVYAVHDLRGEGFSMEDAIIDDETDMPIIRKIKETKYKEPSVIDILLSGDPSAASERDPNGQLPLHIAIMRGKTLEEGVKALADAYPEALNMPDTRTNLYPFMLAASIGRGRGDCSTIYELVRATPELVKMALDGTKSRDSSSSGVSNNSERTDSSSDGDPEYLDQKPSAKKLRIND